MKACPNCGFQPRTIPLETIRDVVCAVMSVQAADTMGKHVAGSARLLAAIRMAALVMHGAGYTDKAIADLFEVNRISVTLRRKKMAQDLADRQTYRGMHEQIMTRLATGAEVRKVG